MSLFQETDATDPVYRIFRDRADSCEMTRVARKYIEDVYVKVKQYLDENFARQLAMDFYARCWELYLAAGILNSQLSLVPRCERCHGTKGPDFLVMLENKPFWFEAINVTAGNGKDRVVDNTAYRPEDIKAHHVQNNEIILRLRSGIEEKYRKYLHYLEQGIVKPTDGFVIALNSSSVSYEVLIEPSIPRIVSCVFPFGDEAVYLDRQTLELTERSFTHRPFVQKSSGSHVSTTIFQDSAYSGISAVLYSGEHVWDDCPTKSFRLCLTNSQRKIGVGSNFLIIHNPLAQVPFPRDRVKYWTEYWMHENQLHCKDSGL